MTVSPRLAVAGPVARRRRLARASGVVQLTLAVLGIAGMVGPGSVSGEFKGAIVYMLIVGLVVAAALKVADPPAFLEDSKSKDIIGFVGAGCALRVAWYA